MASGAGRYRPRALISDPAWAPWALETETYELVKLAEEDPIGDYPVDLDRCRTPAEVLDWVLHLDARSDRSDRVTLGLLRAITDLLQPQEHLCSFGKASQISSSKMRELVDGYVRAHPPLG